jgi:hypothetical protein
MATTGVLVMAVGEQRSSRLEREIRFLPQAARFDPADAAAYGLVYRGCWEWGCTSIFLDTSGHRLAELEASLAVVLAPGIPQSMAWISYKRLSGWCGVVREARDVRHHLPDAKIPEVGDLLAASPAPVAEAVRLLPGRPGRLCPVLALTQRRVQHEFVLPTTGTVVVSVDEVWARVPPAMTRMANFRMLEIDVTRAPEVGAASWSFVELLVERGMALATQPKYQHALELVGTVRR